MTRKTKILNEIKLNKKIKHIRKIEKRKTKCFSEIEIAKKAELTFEEKKKIFELFGRKINIFWHKKFKGSSGKFSSNFFPEIYYNADLKNQLNEKSYCDVFQDKFVLANYLKGLGIDVEVPRHIVSCNNGILLNEKNQRISKNEAFQILQQYDEIFFKCTLDTYGGKGCTKITKISREKFNELVENFNFSFQEVLKNQDDIARLNPSSLNTFRVITYMIDDVVYTSPLILRIGRNGKDIDNAHAGGMFVGVSDEGKIISNAKTVNDETFEKHPDSNIKFIGYHIRNVDLLLKKAKEIAYVLPHTKLLDIDLTINEDGKIVCPEINIDSGSIWLMQMTHGSGVFGEQTEKMIKLIKDTSQIKTVIKGLKKHNSYKTR